MLEDQIIAKLESDRDQEVSMAQGLLYGTSIVDEQFQGKMAAAEAHSTLALVYQHRINEYLKERSK